jgi:hypothetical protein
VELRAEEGDGQRSIVGYAAVFNSLSEDLGGFRERIAPGAFAGAADADVRALFNHDPNLVLGRSTAGTLTLGEDEVGLKIRITPPDTQYARDVMALIERGDVSQMSFGFRTVKDDWEQGDGGTIRTLQQVSLYDVSPVTFPAYPATHVQMRDLMNVPDVPAGVRGATAPAVEDSDELRAQWSQRERTIELLTSA